VLAGAVAAAAVLLVAVAADAAPQGATAARRLTSLGLAGDVAGVVLVTGGALACGLVVLALWPGRGRTADRFASRRARPWWRRLLDQVVAAAVLVGVVALVAMLFSHGPRGARRRAASGATVSSLRAALRGARASHAHVALGSGTVIGLSVATLAVLAVAAALAVHLQRRRRRGQQRDETVGTGPQPLLGAATDALFELGAEADPRKAIVRAYRALEEGLVRDERRAPAEAPLEFRDRLVAAGAPLPPARRLTELFEIARFSDHVVGPEQRDEAMASLEALRARSTCR
jgi:hypothetical protein